MTKEITVDELLGSTMLLRQARDNAQVAYAHAKHSGVTGKAMNAARNAYMLAQSEYRAALLNRKP